ncbi:MAG TPA: FHA domain-containing protein [Kofleriaceae bacterium]|nr:FHA domain-containing protein [Kofleriaceae bacterium]
MFKLVIQDDEGKTTVVPLIRDEITIGRKEGNTIRLTERNVSRRHARILRNNGEVQIEDLGSYNGIRVNNARIAERVSLRVSDQVQIGDYKLYLKAEGVEQVDDARTMPIERLDAQATEQMPAVPPSSPTQPIPAQALAAAATPPAAPRPLGTADTDPSGRPVATAAQVAAMNQAATYGKLCVISSNYAGKEFDLTRPQMIVGRTDENDLVINHRSISRNHAKITRDTETGRYTISDLQSSNGVRVNGQDYGKVELRRGDVIDLGHVRLRFIEPGEDWNFTRDAVIADVPEAGGKRGLLVAIALGVLVLAAVGIYFVMIKKGDDGGKRTDGTNVASGGSNVASGNPDTTNNGGGGSATPQVALDTPDAAVAAVVTPGSGSDEGEALLRACLEYGTNKNWQDLLNCSHKLAKFNPGKAKELEDEATTEQKNDVADGKLDDAIREQDLPKARKILDSIGADSVYRKTAQDKVAGLEGHQVDEYTRRAKQAAAKHRCSDLDTLATQAQGVSPKVVEAVRAVKCESSVASNPPPTGTGPEHVTVKNPPTGTTPTGTTPALACDTEDLKQKGLDHEASGLHAAALAEFEAALKCKPDARVVQYAFMAACNSGNVVKAKQYYRRMTPDAQGRFVQMCIRRNITKDQLDAP